MKVASHTPVAVLGAGISGLAVSHHLGHKDTVIFEKQPYYGGHVHTEEIGGFVWDDGPHVSFTSNKYVQDFLADMVDGAYEVVPSRASNYYRGHWIAHPAQVNLYQVPEPLRSACLESFLASREINESPRNYREWIHMAFGKVFAETFPAAYTRKYWTVDPVDLATEWVGNRIMRPNTEEVVAGAKGSIGIQTVHYAVNRESRYPSRGGFMAYTHKMARGASIRLNCALTKVNFGSRRLELSDGSDVSYGRLVSTIPLKTLIRLSTDAAPEVREAAERLTCTHFLRVDVAVNHPARRPETWMYVYDEDKLSVRLSYMEHFSPNNAPPGCSALQVEVYGSEYRPAPTDFDRVKATVVAELVEMGLVDDPKAVRYVNVTHVPQGNPIFDHNRAAAMKTITTFLDHHGVLLVGRYAEHKYLMTDACVISARRAAATVRGADPDADARAVYLSEAG
jgi:protoporphyrinogen oxidase